MVRDQSLFYFQHENVLMLFSLEINEYRNNGTSKVTNNNNTGTNNNNSQIATTSFLAIINRKCHENLSWDTSAREKYLRLRVASVFYLI